MPTETIQHKYENHIPLTSEEKIQVLKKARFLLRFRWTSHSWSKTVLGIRHYCLYGGLQKVMGQDQPYKGADEHVSACSITSALFDAIPEDSANKKHALKELQHRGPAYADDIKVKALQSVNDFGGRKAVLKVIDETIQNLEDEAGQ